MQRAHACVAGYWSMSVSTSVGALSQSAAVRRGAGRLRSATSGCTRTGSPWQAARTAAQALPRHARRHRPAHTGGRAQVSEAELVREVLCACQAVDGRIIRYSGAAAGGRGGAEVAPEAGVPAVHRQAVLRLCELGWLFRCAARRARPGERALMGCWQHTASDFRLQQMMPEKLLRTCAPAAVHTTVP